MLSSAKMALNLIVFYGSVRDNRVGIQVAKYIEGELKKKGHQVELFDPLELKFPLLTKAHFEYREFNEQPEDLQKARRKVQNADGYVVVSGEYNYTIPPALTNMMDHFSPADYTMKPCSIATYSMGSFGGVSAAGHLRGFLGGIGLLTLPHTYHVPTILETYKDGKPANDRLVSGVDTLVNQLEFAATAMKNHNKATKK